MNSIVIDNKTFNDEKILSQDVYLSNAPIGESLEIDTLTAQVNAEGVSFDIPEKFLTSDLEQLVTSDNKIFNVPIGSMARLPYGTEVQYNRDGSLFSKFYVTSVEQTGRNVYTLNCNSAIGVLEHIPHYGGVYEGSNTTVGNLVRAIFSKIGYTEGTDYTIASEVNGLFVNGWLPVASCRDNLRQILFSIGASIIKRIGGNIEVKFISTSELTQIADERIYIGGTVDNFSHATEIRVTEHEYHALATDEFATLYDNTGSSSATNEVVLFEKPCHKDITTGQWITTGTLTVTESGANYAVVSGQGTLSGYRYTHTTRIVNKVIEPNPVEENIVSVTDATLVSPANSLNVAARVAAYYGRTKEISCGITLTDNNLKPTSRITFTDPFGNVKVGYIKSMDINVSNTLKANAVIATDWKPSHFGNNFTDSEVITSGTVWHCTKTGTVRIMLIGGGQGGTGGSKGADGSNVQPTTSFDRGWAQSGNGGAKGAGGNGGKVYTFDVNVVAGTDYAISLGAGGSGGAINGGTGGAGGATTITINGTTYTSANGSETDSCVNPLTGETYARKGWSGIDGQKGEADPNYHEWEPNTQVQISNDRYGTVTLDKGGYTRGYGSFGWTLDGVLVAKAWAGCGGGGAFCSNGVSASANPVKGGTPEGALINDANAGTVLSLYGHGASGANAWSLEQYINSTYNNKGWTYQLGIGQGGVGGNGGGGGGGGGSCGANATARAHYQTVYYGGIGGTGGNGSKGCTGGAGGIVILI